MDKEEVVCKTFSGPPYATSIVSQQFLASLLLNYPEKIKIDKAVHWGKDAKFGTELWFIQFQAPSLKFPGNNGSMDIITESYHDLKFKLDADV